MMEFAGRSAGPQFSNSVSSHSLVSCRSLNLGVAGPDVPAAPVDTGIYDVQPIVRAQTLQM